MLAHAFPPPSDNDISNQHTTSQSIAKPFSYKALLHNVSFQIVFALLLGVGIGLLGINPDSIWHTIAVGAKPLSTIFIHLIKMVITPLLFATLVVGIAGGGHDPRKVGRVGLKAFIYFEIATTAALIIGLLVANWLQPGIGTGLDPNTIMHQNAGEAANILSNAKAVAGSHDWSHFLLSMIPESPVGAMAEGKILQVVFFSVMFALALMASGDKGKPILEGLESLSDVMFKLVGMVMRVAPFGVFGALASAVALNGTKVFGAYINLIGSLYLALGIFLVLIPGLTCLLMGISIPKLFKAIADPLLLAFTTTSSESAMPKAMESLQRFGVPRDIVGFVLPTGYSFNLDGSTLYLCLASLFIAQVLNVHLSIQEQITLVLTLMVTSKGVAAVPRASLVILAGTLAAFKIPVEGVALLLGVDHVLDMARTSVNLLGNCVASVVVAKWEGVLTEGDMTTVTPETNTEASPYTTAIPSWSGLPTQEASLSETVTLETKPSNIQNTHTLSSMHF